MRKALVVALLILAAACKERDPIRATIDEVAAAAEDRDVDDVMKHLAASYPARQEVAESLRRYFFGYRSIDVSIKNFTAERGATTAAATFDVEFTGVPKQIGGLDQLLPSGARYRFDVQLVKEGNEWKIESAEYVQVERPVTECRSPRRVADAPGRSSRRLLSPESDRGSPSRRSG